MTEYTTAGEAFVERELRKEKRDGVEHYVVGQHRARIEPREDPNIEVAVVTYCSHLGAVALPVVRVFGTEWEPALELYRCVGLSMDYGLKSLPAGFKLSDEMLAALKDAEA